MWNWILFIVCGWSLNVVVSLGIHILAYKNADGEKAIEFPKLELFNNIKTELWKKVLSVDYWIADLYKKKIEEDSEKKALFLKMSNKYNLYLSILLIFIFVLNLRIDVFSIYFYKLSFSFFATRAMSRSFEIIFAFYKDIHENDKSSNLDASNRIKLAVKSFFEIIINFTLVYYYLNLIKPGIDFYVVNLVNSIVLSVGTSTFTGVEFLTVSKCNPFNYYDHIAKNLLILIQLLSSMCLTYFALARYIGDQSDGNGFSFGKSATKKYIEKNKAEKIIGLKKLLNEREKDIYNDLEKSTRSFIRNDALLEDVDELRAMLDEREKSLSEDHS